MMDWLLIPSIGFLLAMVCHAVLSRLASGISRVLLFVTIGTIVGAGLLYIAATGYGLWSAKALASTLVYAAACELYIFVFTLAMASISANVLVRLKEEPLSVEDLSRIYDGRTMTSQRVERLISLNLACDENNLLSLTPRGCQLARIFTAIRRLLHPARST